MHSMLKARMKWKNRTWKNDFEELSLNEWNERIGLERIGLERIKIERGNCTQSEIRILKTKEKSFKSKS
jgi:uncharacterized small protein (DUF1192 family)